VKYPNESSFTTLVASGDANQITITTVPAQLQLKIDEIIPPISRPSLKVTYDGVAVNPSSQQTYLIKVDSKKNHTIVITVSDEQGKVSSQQYTVISDVSPIV
jgi:hypothetical protein